ncbi:MAG: TIR domain-containing protein [Ktedonobacteraceae bacterium]
MDEISISLRLPLDDDGFLRRECPHCGRQFKQRAGAADETQESPGTYYCPYCSASADADAWFTAQQLEYIQQQAMAEIIGPSLSRLQQQLEQANQSSLLRIEMTSPVPTEPEPLAECNDMVGLVFPCHVDEPIKVDEHWDQELTCVVCGTRYPVDEVRAVSREEVGEKLRMEREKREHPNVFVSHASEDKDRFVRAFTTQLREKGIEAWVDEWEIYPGDSLVQKIYDAGISAAQAVLIVLSRNSVDKPWVKDELDVSVIRKIEEGMRIIPIVLDDCRIPTALRATLHVRIPDLNNFDAQLSSIVDTLYGRSKKPALGSAPAYTQNLLEQIPGLSRIDSLLLKMAGDKAIENGHRFTINTPEMLNQAALQDISPYQFYESLTVLGDSHYLDLTRTLGGEPTDPKLREMVRGGVPFFAITIDGFEKYAKAYIPEYKAIVRDIHLQIVNEDKSDSASIASTINQPLRVVEHIFELLGRSGDIKIIEAMGSTTMHFINPSQQLRRRLEENDIASDLIHQQAFEHPLYDLQQEKGFSQPRITSDNLSQERSRCASTVKLATPRQREVLQAFSKGLHPQQVADKLGISLATGDSHKTALLRLCHNIWNIDEQESLNYHFLQTKFADYFPNEELSSQETDKEYLGLVALPFDEFERFLRDQENEYWIVDKRSIEEFIYGRPANVDELIYAITMNGDGSECIYLFRDDISPEEIIEATNWNAIPRIKREDIGDYVVGTVKGKDLLWFDCSTDEASNCNPAVLLRYEGTEEEDE